MSQKYLFFKPCVIQPEQESIPNWTRHSQWDRGPPRPIIDTTRGPRYQDPRRLWQDAVDVRIKNVIYTGSFTITVRK